VIQNRMRYFKISLLLAIILKFIRS